MLNQSSHIHPLSTFQNFVAVVSSTAFATLVGLEQNSLIILSHGVWGGKKIDNCVHIILTWKGPPPLSFKT